MSLLSILKPDPFINEIEEESLVKKEYRYWRVRIFYGMYVGYALFYFTRKSFTFAMPAMQSELGMDKVQLGLLASILSITYGASKFLSGILGDKSNPRYFMSIGLILTGVFNICFGASSTWMVFAIFWGLNGWFQGWGWPGCAKLLTHWYSQSERGRWWSAWNTSHNLGGALIPLIVAGCVELFSWRYGLYVPGVICVVAGIFLANRLRDTPQSLGLPSIERFRNDYPSSQKQEGSEPLELSAREILLEYVVKNKFIWMLAFASFFIYVIRTAINDWSMLYLTEAKGYSTFVAGVCMSGFELGGFLGSLAAGWGSDLIFKGKRMPINVLFSLGILITLVGFRMSLIQVAWIDGLYLFCLGFLIFGPQMLIGVACAELSHKKAAGSATGFAGCFAYLGAAVAGGPLGALTYMWGWEAFFMAMIVCSGMAILLMTPLWKVRSRVQRHPV